MNATEGTMDFYSNADLLDLLALVNEGGVLSSRFRVKVLETSDP